MKIRNPFALRARHRQAGAMHDRRAPRGGERQQVRRELHELRLECASCDETLLVFPARGGSTEVRTRHDLCPGCLQRSR